MSWSARRPPNVLRPWPCCRWSGAGRWARRSSGACSPRAVMPPTCASSRATPAGCGVLEAALPGVEVTGEPGPADGTVLAVKPNDVAAVCRSVAAAGRRAGAVDRRRASRSPPSRPSSPRARPWCGPCRTRPRSWARARPPSPAARRRPTTTWRGRSRSSARSARSSGWTRPSSTPSPACPARARPTSSSWPRR